MQPGCGLCGLLVLSAGQRHVGLLGLFVLSLLCLVLLLVDLLLVFAELLPLFGGQLRDGRDRLALDFLGESRPVLGKEAAKRPTCWLLGA